MPARGFDALAAMSWMTFIRINQILQLLSYLLSGVITATED
jgi:hypothetical protein